MRPIIIDAREALVGCPRRIDKATGRAVEFKVFKAP